MTRTTTRRTVPRAGRTAALALAVGLALAGCGGGDDATVTVDEGKDGGVTVEGDDGSVTIDEGKDGGITVEGDDGSTFSADTGGSLPDNWPADVPVIDGTVLYAQTASDESAGTTYSAAIETEGTIESVYEQIRSDLEGAGFTKTAEVTSTDGSFASFTGDTYQVTVTVAESEGKVNAIYIVAPVS